MTYRETPLLVLGDTAKLRQIVLNLLSNAIKFTKVGGCLALAAPEAEGDRVEIRVTDSGIGMSKDVILIALAPFGQVDSSLSRRYEGTGLGLPVTKVLAELHGGEFAIVSEPSVGATVFVYLPRAAGLLATVLPYVRAAG